jgi:FtsZ-interacting cell division protein ZipA
MSELQLSLLVIGALLVIAVYLFNRFQERNYRRRSEQAFGEEPEDVLLRNTGSPLQSGHESRMREPQDERIEPAFESSPELEEPSAETRLEPQAREPRAAEAQAREQRPGEPRAAEVQAREHRPGEPRDAEPRPAEPETREQQAKEPQTRELQPAPLNGYSALDPAIHYIVVIRPPRAVPATALSGVAARTRDIGRPVLWAGLNSESGHWEEIRINGAERYSELKAGLQLLNRSGPASEQQLETFSDLIEDSAAEWGATVERPEAEASLVSARKLDDFCAQVDVLIGLNIVSAAGAPFHGTKVRTLAESAGFRLNAEGAFEYPSDHGVPLFYLSNQEAQPFVADRIRNLTTKGVTLLFDVPRVPEGLRVFDRMVVLARRFAEILGGVFVDDNGRPLNDDGIGKIREQLRGIYQAMEAREIPPGSPRALKLFS